LFPKFALPKYNNFPTCTHKRSARRAVALSVPGDFLRPVGLIAFWRARAACAIMSVPEAAVHENHSAPSRENQIRFTWEILAVQPEPVAHPVRQAPHQKLRRGVLAFHRLHRSPSDFRRFHQALLMAVSFDSRTTAPPRRMQVFRIVSAPWCSTSKST